MSSPLFFFSQASVLEFECNVMLLMWSVSKPILLRTRLSCANRELGFPRPVQMKESNHLKTHKRAVFPLGLAEEMDLCNMVVIHTEPMCACIDLRHVHSFQLSWEICSKLDFKQAWVCLMRCWSEVQVWSHKTGCRSSLPAWEISMHTTILSRSRSGADMNSSGALWCGKWEW